MGVFRFHLTKTQQEIVFKSILSLDQKKKSKTEEENRRQIESTNSQLVEKASATQQPRRDENRHILRCVLSGNVTTKLLIALSLELKSFSVENVFHAPWWMFCC